MCNSSAPFLPSPTAPTEQLASWAIQGHSSLQCSSKHLREVSPHRVVRIGRIRYAAVVGSLDAVATVLGDLAEELNARKLVEAAQSDVELTVVQRDGYLIVRIGRSGLADRPARWLAKRKPVLAKLRPDRKRKARLEKKYEAQFKVVFDAIRCPGSAPTHARSAFVMG
jgi:hypothetical protein